MGGLGGYKEREEKKLEHKPVVVNNGKEAAMYLKDCKNICILTGAGLSAASGIPTFRGAEGFWKKSYAGVSNPEELLTTTFFK